MNSTNRCQICNVENATKLEPDYFTEAERLTFIDSVFSGQIDVYRLDVDLYLKMSRKMSESIVKGFGTSLDSFDKDSEPYLLLQDLIESGYFFNAAKQYQLVREISDLVNKDFESKEEYYTQAIEIFDKYNVTYFETELDSAEYQAKAANEWLDFVKWNNE